MHLIIKYTFEMSLTSLIFGAARLSLTYYNSFSFLVRILIIYSHIYFLHLVWGIDDSVLKIVYKRNIQCMTMCFCFW